jgi:hypothetical protein
MAVNAHRSTAMKTLSFVILSSWLCVAASTHAQENPLRGTTQSVIAAGGGDNLCRILVDKQAWVFVTKSTKVFRLDGKECTPVTVKDLKVAQFIEARYSGEVRDTDPPQVDADEVVILGNKKIEFRGTITKVRRLKRAKEYAFIHAEGTKEQIYDKVIITLVFEKTKVFTFEGKDRKAASFEDLIVGTTIEARFDRPMRETYPAEVSGEEIVIVAKRIK